MHVDVGLFLANCGRRLPSFYAADDVDAGALVDFRAIRIDSEFLRSEVGSSLEGKRVSAFVRAYLHDREGRGISRNTFGAILRRVEDGAPLRGGVTAVPVGRLLQWFVAVLYFCIYS